MPASTAVAIFSVDPGGTTGCSTLLGDLRRLTVQAVMRRARAKGLIETWEETGDFVTQGWSIARKVVDFYYKTHVELGIVQRDSFYVVSEGFQLRQMSADLSPVAVMSSFETLLKPAFGSQWGEPFFIKQTASQAKSFCTDDMLNRWGLLKGLSPHERDSLRHIAKRLDALL